MAHPLASGVYPYDATKRAEAIQIARQPVEQDVDEPPPKRVTPEKHMGGRCVHSIVVRHRKRQNDPRTQSMGNFSLAPVAVDLILISAKHEGFESSSKVAPGRPSRRFLGLPAKRKPPSDARLLEALP